MIIKWTQKRLDRSSFCLSHSLIKYCDNFRICKMKVPKLNFTTHKNSEFRQKINFKTYHRSIRDEKQIFDNLPLWYYWLDLQLFSSSSTRLVWYEATDWNRSWSLRKRSYWLQSTTKYSFSNQIKALWKEKKSTTKNFRLWN